ncbi:hemicentin-1-like [Portunus trituberculatus]|uniref:hemicentin-1-like n=1 Tax=Portunus trituberculatus TaxID=210409 RepID=UPI001E1CC503|nr:hemicentin-1-like [Portunus trituberculatus]
MSDVAATDPVKARLLVNALETPTRLSRSSLIVVIVCVCVCVCAPSLTHLRVPHRAYSRQSPVPVGDLCPPASFRRPATFRASTAALEQQQPTVVVTEVEESSLTNLTAQLGTSVFLPCRTEEPTERQVSWVRRRDWHILTSGTLTYTREGRFAVHHPEGSTEWTLAIKYVTLDDAGTYECQVSTGDGLASHLVVLEVVAPRAVIPGQGVHHVQAGSTISLTCLIEQSPEAPQYIFWYHDSRMINYDRRRGGVEVRVEAGPKVASRLKVSGARPEDSGNYTCAAANTEAASVFVYVTDDNKIAAVQPRALGRGTSHQVTLPALGVMLLAVVLHAR